MKSGRFFLTFIFILFMFIFEVFALEFKDEEIIGNTDNKKPFNMYFAELNDFEKLATDETHEEDRKNINENTGNKEQLSKESDKSDVIEKLTLDEIVVTGKKSKKEKIVFDSPDPVIVLTREHIDRIKPKSIGDLFLYEPGLDITDDATYWARKPMIRGLAADRVLVIVDGARLKTHLGMGGAYLSLIDPDMVETIEIIKGPKSVMYGSNAIGGVIKITTKDPKKTAQMSKVTGSLETGYTSVNKMKSGRVGVAGNSGKVSFVGGISYRDAGDYDLPDGGQEESAFKENNIDFSLSYDIKKDHNMEFSYNRHRTWDVSTAPFLFNVDGEFMSSMMDLAIMDTMGSLIDFVDNMAKNKWVNLLGLGYLSKIIGMDFDQPFITTDFRIGFNEMVYERYAFDYTLNNISSFWDEIKFNIYYQDTPMDFFVNIKPNIFDMNVVEIAVTTKFTVETTGGTIDNKFKFNDHTVDFGVEIYNDSANGDPMKIAITPMQMPAAIQMELPPLNAELNSFDIYVQDEWVVSDFFTLIAGVRKDYTESKNFVEKGNVLQDSLNFLLGIDDLNVDHEDSKLTYSVQTVFNLTDHVKLLASAATGFRVPNLMERYLVGSIGIATAVANPYLEPEDSLNYEIGLKGYNPGKWDWQITVFKSYLDNMIAAHMMMNMESLIQFRNVKEAEMEGGEASLSYYIDNNFLTFANIAYCKGENTVTGGNLNSVPPLNGLVGFRYEKDNFYSVDEFWTQFEARLVDRHDDLEQDNGGMVDSMFQMAPGFGDVETPGFAVFNIRAGFCIPQNIIEQKTTITMAVENVLNKDYTEPLSFQRTQPGRNFKFFVNTIF